MNISNIYLREKNFKLSLKYINDTYDIALKLNDKIGVAYCYYQLGLINRDQKKLEIAKDYFEKSLAIFIKENSRFQIAELTNFIGEVTTDYKQKLNLFLKSKSVWDEIDPSYVSAINNSNQIAKIYIEVIKNDNLKKESGIIKTNTQLLSEAEKLVNESIENSKKSDVKQYLMDSYLLLSKIKHLKSEFLEAYNYSILHTEIKDSIFSQENKNKIAALESQKEIAIRDNEIQLNKLTLETKEKQKWLYIGGIFLLVIIGLLLFYQSRNRQKTNQKLQLLNSELDHANKIKTRFFSILNHDLRSPVANLIHFLHLQKDNPELMDEATKNRMQNKTISGAENLLSSMEDILLWSKGQMENFKPEPKKVTVNQLFEDNKKVFSGYQNITFDYQNPDAIELFTDENYLKTIIRNLTSNAINVFTTTQNPTIIWKAWQENGKSYLSISDNGPGASQEQFKALYDDKEVVGIKSGLGLHLIRDLAKAINCEILVDSKLGEGTNFTLKL